MLEKLDDNSKHSICNSISHFSPMFIKHDPGTYKWTCPDCGNVIIFTVPEIKF